MDVSGMSYDKESTPRTQQLGLDSNYMRNNFESPKNITIEELVCLVGCDGKETSALLCRKTRVAHSQVWCVFLFLI